MSKTIVQRIAERFNNLTPEEREVWEKELEWEQQERARRKKEGYYPYDD